MGILILNQSANRPIDHEMLDHRDSPLDIDLEPVPSSIEIRTRELLGHAWHAVFIGSRGGVEESKVVQMFDVGTAQPYISASAMQWGARDAIESRG